MPREKIALWLMQLRTCRYEHPAVRRPLVLLRYTNMAITMLLFGSSLTTTLMIRAQVYNTALVTGGNPDTVANQAFNMLLPGVIILLIVALVLSEIVYFSCRAFLLRRLKMG